MLNINNFEDYLKEERLNFTLVYPKRTLDELKISWDYLVEDIMPVGVFENQHILSLNFNELTS